MTISLALLAVPHTVAARTIVQQALLPGVDLDDLVIGVSEVRPDGDGDLPVYIDSDAYNDPEFTYRGSVTMRYKRLDLAETLGHLGLRVYVGPTYRSLTVIQRLAAVLQLQFDSADYINEEFPLTVSGRMVMLKAAPDSPRWKGEVPVFVYR